jgi:hypothetical protein
MAKDLIMPILAAILVGTVPPVADASGSKKAKPLRDGFVLAGVNGKLTSQDSNGGCQGWFFEFDSQLSDDKGRVKAGASLELLPSAALEKMTADAQKRSTKSYVLWGATSSGAGSQDTRTPILYSRFIFCHSAKSNRLSHRCPHHKKPVKKKLS